MSQQCNIPKKITMKSPWKKTSVDVRSSPRCTSSIVAMADFKRHWSFKASISGGQRQLPRTEAVAVMMALMMDGFLQGFRGFLLPTGYIFIYIYIDIDIDIYTYIIQLY
jgi:hypothetical protein